TFLDPISPYISQFSFYIPVYTITLQAVSSVLILIACFVGYYLIRHKEYISSWTANLLLAGSGIFAIIAYINMNSLLGGDIVLLLIILAVTVFILVQELRAYVKRKDNKIEVLKTEEEETGNHNGISIYGIASIAVLVLSMTIAFIGYEEFPFSLGLFFFRLETFGGFIGLVSIIVVIILYILLGKKVKTPKNKSEIYYLPYIFRIFSLILVFLAIVYIFEMNSFLLFRMTLSIAAPIGLAALGGMFSEKSGVVNIGLEGMMLTGAFVAVWVSYVTNDPWAGVIGTNDPWAGVIGAMIAGALMGLLHAIASIKYRADQVVVGVAINLLASALTTLGIYAVWQVQGTSKQAFGLPKIRFFIFQDLPILGDLTGGGSGLDPLVYVFIALTFISAWIISRTSFGLRVRAVGEHPRAADTLGINVYKTRYICVTLSGVLSAIGGAQLTLGTVPVFLKNMTTGRGFVALAALIFGAWAPIGATLASLLFAFAFAFRFQLEALGINWIFMNLHLEKLTPSLPYVITIVAVSTVARRMRPPAADGIPYTKEGH
ncbi:MAG: ABC transporter permease, partial [Candidatus Hodarchaeales archaeon]